MPGSTFWTDAYWNESTDIRGFVTAVTAGMTAAGWVQTADTGQLNVNTLTWTGELSTANGYQIWRMNDSLQATRPIFLKLEYGIGLTNNFNPQLWFTVGTATDGNGGLSAATSFPFTLRPRTAMLSTATSSTRFAPTHLYGDGSSVAIATWVANTDINSFGGPVVIIERTRNGDGTANGDGFYVWYSYGATTTSCESFLFLSSPVNPPAEAQGYAMCAPSLWNTSFVGTNWHVYPFFTGFVPRLYAPSQRVVAMFQNDAPPAYTFTAQHYGAPHPFIHLGQQARNASRDPVSTLVTLALRTD